MSLVRLRASFTSVVVMFSAPCFAVSAGFATALALTLPVSGLAQTAVPHATGTVTAVAANAVTLKTDAGIQVAVTVPAEAKILVVAPGSKTLAGATPATLADIAVGDKALVNGRTGDTATALNAVRVVLIKSTAIAARNESEQADWQRRGTGGIVKSVDGPVVTVSAGARTLKIDTSSSTVFKRYAADSIKFEDAKTGTLDQIHPGDQLRARGDKSEDGLTIKAEEVVTGTFDNLSGQIASVNLADGSLTLKDLATKKTFTVKVTANSDLRKLPPEAAAMLAAGNRPGGAGAPAGTGTPGTRPAGAGGYPGTGSYPGAGGAPGPPAGGWPGAGAAGASGGPRRRSGDLSQMVGRFPTEGLADLKPGTAVLIVASQGQTPTSATAITLLSDVEALLTAAPGAEPFTLSPWSLAAPEGGGSGGPQ